MPSLSTPASRIVEQLKDDHLAILHLFAQFSSAPIEARGTIALTAIHRLRLHSDLEHKVLYPAIRDVIDRPGLVERAMKEHDLIKRAIRKLMRLRPCDGSFQAMFCELGEKIQSHITTEERDLLPQAETSDLDWERLEAHWIWYARAIEEGRSRGAQRNNLLNGRS